MKISILASLVLMMSAAAAHAAPSASYTCEWHAFNLPKENPRIDYQDLQYLMEGTGRVDLSATFVIDDHGQTQATLTIATKDGSQPNEVMVSGESVRMAYNGRSSDGTQNLIYVLTTRVVAEIACKPQ